MRMGRIENVELDRTPQVGGWRWTVFYRVRTANQFTDERLTATGHSRWLWSALWSAWRAGRKAIATLAAKPGERELVGW